MLIFVFSIWLDMQSQDHISVHNVMLGSQLLHNCKLMLNYIIKNSTVGVTVGKQDISPVSTQYDVP